jgi:hypothetical protein
MHNTKKVGRNDPCPCGSSKKYKYCCAQKQMPSTNPLYLDLEVERDKVYFELNKAIAYKGNIGHQRENFCIAYTKFKKLNLTTIERVLNKKLQQSGKTADCRRGCYECCSLYTEVNIQECELIVYYLYNNESILSSFWDNYSRWREKLRKNGDIFRQLGDFWNKTITHVTSSSVESVYDEAATKYVKQHIFCPFLRDKICTIYEVRPYVCAGFISTTPREWCNPLHPKHELWYHLTAYCPPRIMLQDTSFYYKNLTRPVMTFAPLIVYEILKGGFSYLSNLPGIEGLASEAMHDSSIKQVIAEYGITYQ